MPAAQDLLDQLTSKEALASFVAAWQGGTLPKAAWAHAAHVAVCAWHAWPDHTVDTLLPRMRAGIRAYNEAVGSANTASSGYHETLILFCASGFSSARRGGRRLRASLPFATWSRPWAKPVSCTRRSTISTWCATRPRGPRGGVRT